jgi:hypothetical protein
MTADFRALCKELVELLEVSEEWSGCTPPQALTRARTALAEDPVGPTNEELDELKENLWNTYKDAGYRDEEVMYEHSFGFALDAFARAVLAQPEPVAPTDEELLGLAEDAWIPFAKSQPHPQGHPWDLVLARAVLAKWGQPAAFLSHG